MQFHHLWRSVVVFNCSSLFLLIQFYCLLVQYSCCSSKNSCLVLFLWRFWVINKTSSTSFMLGNTPKSSRSCNIFQYIEKCYSAVFHRCTPSSASTFYNLLQYFNSSTFYLIILLYVIIKESLKPISLNLYFENPLVMMNTLRLECMFSFVPFRWSPWGNPKTFSTQQLDRPKHYHTTKICRNVPLFKKCMEFWQTGKEVDSKTSDTYKIFWMKTCRNQVFLNQNLTRCWSFTSKSNTL